MMSKNRKKYAIQMSYDVSDEEKNQAEKTLKYLDFLLKTMKQAEEYLNLLYQPFKDGTNIDPEMIWKSRAALRRYRDTMIDNFDKFKRISFKCFALLQNFSSDTQILKLNKSFVFSVADIEKQVNRFADLFSDLKSKEFSQEVIKAIDNIKKETAQLEEIIDSRVKSYLTSNILSRDWTDQVSQRLQEKIEQKIPFALKLKEEREKNNK